MSFYRKSYRPRRGGEEPEKCADPAKARARALDALSAREMTSTQLYERLCARFTEQAAAAACSVKRAHSRSYSWVLVISRAERASSARARALAGSAHFSGSSPPRRGR